MPRPVCRISGMDDHPPMLDINVHGRLVSTSPRSLACVGWIDSVVSNSRYGSVSLFDVSQFGFVFDDFVFELGERTIFHVGINLDLVFFGVFSLVGRPYYAVCGNFERNLFAHYFLLVL